MAARRGSKTYLDFVIREYGFEIDFPESVELPEDIDVIRRSFEENQYRALYLLGFKEPEPWI